MACTAAPTAAQQHRTDVPEVESRSPVPRFAIHRSPIQLEADVRPGEYLGVTGPRSAWLGAEPGPAELWVHPLKVAKDFQLHFKIPAYREPVPGTSVARRVTVRPEATTLTYTHSDFTVRQHVVAPRDEAGLLILLEVETFVPLEIVVQFRPVLQYMWPGSFGGQYVFWDEDHDAFVLSESTQQRNAVIGTSWPSEGEAHPAHRLAEAPATFVIAVDSARAAEEFVPIAVAAGTAPRDEVFETWRRLLNRAEEIYRSSRRWADDVLASTTSLDTPDDSLDLALEWSKINLEEQRVCNPDLGCGFVAGWGMSGTSTRPGFGWYFGGDAAITSLAMDATGQWGPVAEDLRFLARYQRDDGKIPHEISQSAAHIPWFEEYPYPYYHADTTPYWMVALWKYWKASGDEETLGELWDDFLEAYAWCLTAETDGDGIIENSVGGYGAIEVGGLGEDLHQDIYLAAVWIAALDATEELARHMGREALADEASALRDKAYATLNEEYWLPEADQHAFGLMTGRRTNENLTAWPGTAASFRVLEPRRAERTLRKLATDSISADWGARLLSVGSDLYDPTHYNNGAVWPFMTGFVAWGQYRYRRPWAGWGLVDAVKHHTFDWARGRFPENFSGAFYQPMDATVPHQFFATSMLAMPLLRGVLGWEPDAPRGRATLAPQLPPAWDRLVARRLRVGGSSLTATLVREPQRAITLVEVDGPPVTLDLVQSVPPGASDIFLEVLDAPPGALPEPRVETGAHDITARVSVPVDSSGVTVLVSWTGGLTVEHPSVALEPGQTSGGLRVVDFVWDDGAWELTVEGDGGRSYEVELRGTAVVPEAAEGARVATSPRDGDLQTLTVTFPDGPVRAAGVVRLAPDPQGTEPLPGEGSGRAAGGR
jgi:glycogen debranching enzyme